MLYAHSAIDASPLRDVRPRCAHTRHAGNLKGQRCGRILGELLTRPWDVRCTRCGNVTERR